ncbi:SpoIID/LytB domain containing protein, partial [Candidatus Arthromitus sp. SFB-3]
MIKYILKKFSLLLLIFMCVFFLLPLAVIGISYNEDFKGFINVNQEDVIIKLYRHETDSVEELKLEEYLEGVLAAEMPVKFDIEALKAQAVTS